MQSIPVTIACGAAALMLPSCTTGGSGGGGGGGAAWQPGSGGDVGASCPQKAEGIACTADLSAKVRCKDGAWLDDGACAKGLKCVETKATDGSGTIIATACVAPPTANPSLAAACARYDACYSEGGVGECMEIMSQANAWTQLWKKLAWLPEMDDMAILQVPAKQSCLLAAKDCAAVSACFTAGVPKYGCGGGKVVGCTGSVAWFCENGVPLTIDCSLFGMPCRTVTDQISFCAHQPDCSAGKKGTTCKGTVAHICKQADATTFDGWTIDCAGIGMTCLPEVNDDDPDVCGQAGAASCDVDTFKKRCEGNVLVECNEGQELRMDCGLIARKCTVEGFSGDADADCRRTNLCPTDKDGDPLPDSCQGNVLTFCDGKTVASLDCAKYGMTCKAEYSATCVF